MLLEGKSSNSEGVAEKNRQFAAGLDDVVNDLAYFDKPSKVKLPMVSASEALSNILGNFGLQTFVSRVTDGVQFVLGDWFMPASFESWRSSSIESDIGKYVENSREVI